MSPAVLSQTPAAVLLSVQVENATRAQRLAALNLSPLKRKAPSLPIIDAVVSLKVTLTIDGASYLTVAIDDPDWLIEGSGLLDLNDDGRLDPNIVITLDRVRFRVVGASRSGDTLTLTAEDEVWVLLDQHNKPRKWSRGSVTRAEAIFAMVNEIRAQDIPVFVPQLHDRPQVARPELPATAPHGSTGFDQGVSFKIKGVNADASQMREVATALGQADLLQAPTRARLALLAGGIGESEFRAIANRKGSPYGGILQGKIRSDGQGPKEFDVKDSAGESHYFLKGGKGYQAGGAIDLANRHPQMQVGEIALRVLGSASNFPSLQAGIDFYQAGHDEAVAINNLWKSGSGAANSEVLSFKEFEFTRGLPGQKETSGEAATRLAREVNWRFGALGGVAFFVNDDYLLSEPAALVIDRRDANSNLRRPAEVGLLKWPDYDHDERKLVSEVTLDAVATGWAVLPGQIVVLRNLGTLTGRWICETFEFDVFDPTAAKVTLARPLTPRKEPAPEAVTVQSDSADGTNTPSGASGAVAWARSRIGHYKEEFGANIGPELDTLEKRYGMRGAPWCAMFATTALVHGGLTRDCRTAAVADINRWCAEGSHGFEKGFKATPRVGDLITFGNDHVALVTKVDNNSVDIVEGNNSAGTVGARTVLRDQGKFVRPDWPA